LKNTADSSEEKIFPEMLYVILNLVKTETVFLFFVYFNKRFFLHFISLTRMLVRERFFFQYLKNSVTLMRFKIRVDN
jgi:hypothetical protein